MLEFPKDIIIRSYGLTTAMVRDLQDSQWGVLEKRDGMTLKALRERGLVHQDTPLLTDVGQQVRLILKF